MGSLRDFLGVLLGLGCFGAAALASGSAPWGLEASH